MQYKDPILASQPLATSNLLDNRQRSRLVRSTRKLGAILGTTPHVAEPERNIPISVLPIGPGAASSASSIRSATPDSIKKSRRQASICDASQIPHLVYSSSSASSSVASLALSTTSSSSMSSDTHYYVEKYLEKEASSFKKKSTKRKGPAELPRPLVLRLKAVPASKPVSPPLTPSSTSLPTPGMETPTGIPPVLTPTTPVFPTASEMRRKRMAKLTRTLGEIIPPHLVFASSGSDESHESFSPLTLESSTSGPKAGRSRSMSVDYTSQGFPSSRSSQVWAVDGESWRGEWNRKDIREVQKQLRSLKAW